MKGRWRLRFRLRSVARSIRVWFRTHIPNRLWGTFLFASLLLGTGTVGYRWIEGEHWSYFDGFYMTAVTLTTIGYGETHELSNRGRAFTVVLAYSGIFTLAYLASELVRSVVTGEIRDVLGRQWVDEELRKLTGHTIVCGYGRMGKIICVELERQRKRFVVIDRSPELLTELPYRYGLPLHGDASVDDVLRKAGAERARSLITAVSSDADNLYICLTARLLNKSLMIVARAEEEEAEVKLMKVGANKVISPYLSGGHRAVQAVVRPTALNFMELATRPEFADIQIEEISVFEGSRLAGHSLRHHRIHQDLGIVIFGILRPGGELLYKPPADTIMEPGATLVALGQRKQLDRLEILAGSEEHSHPEPPE